MRIWHGHGMCRGMPLSGFSTAVLAAPQTPPAERARRTIRISSPFRRITWPNGAISRSGPATSSSSATRNPGTTIYNWTISARGIFRLVYSDDVIQQSWFNIVGDHVQPREISRRARLRRRVNFDFDWNTGHAFGSSEGKQVDLALEPGHPGPHVHPGRGHARPEERRHARRLQLIDKDQMKDFMYTREGTAKLRTALGTLDTIIVASRRSAQRQPSPAHVVCARPGFRAGAGRAHARRQARVRDAHQDPTR